MVLSLAVVICLPGVASADWVQAMFEDGYAPYTIPNPSPFDKLEVFMLDGTTLTLPFFTSLPASWSSSVVNGSYCVATGPTVTPPDRLYYSFQISNPSSSPIVFDYLIWNDDHLVGTQHITWSTSGMSLPYFDGDGIQAYNGTYYDRDPPLDFATPLPPSLLLLGSGLLGLVGLRGRKVKDGLAA